MLGLGLMGIIENQRRNLLTQKVPDKTVYACVRVCHIAVDRSYYDVNFFSHFVEYRVCIF